MVPLHYDNMHIFVIDKLFLRLRKKTIFFRGKIVIFPFFSNHRLWVHLGESEVYPNCIF